MTLNEVDTALNRQYKKGNGFYWSEDDKSWIISSPNFFYLLKNSNDFSVVRPLTTVGRLHKDIQSEFNELDKFYKSWLLLNDGSYHSDYRKEISYIFGSQNFNLIKNDLKHIVENELINMSDNTSLDIVKDYIFPIALKSMLHISGLEYEDYECAGKWSDIFTDFLINRNPTYEDALLAQETLIKIKSIISKQRDVGISKKYLFGIKTNKLNQETLDNICIGVLVDGIGPLKGALSLACLERMQNTNTFHESPEVESFKDINITELLRLSNFFQYIARYAKKDIEIEKDLIIKKGERMMFIITLANQDRDRYSCPNSYSVDNKGISNYTFGYGSHGCLGVRISKYLTYEVISGLMTEFNSLELLDVQLNPNNKRVIRTIESIKIRTGRREFY